MTLTIDNSRYLARQVARKAVQTSTASRPDGAAQQRVPSVSPAARLPEDFEYHAKQARFHFPGDQLSLRGQRAIRSYSSVTEIDERTRVSDLLGLNEYA
ncbi:MAG: hypothetical protein KDI47_00605 [Gammaproteobacteria bacterium]|nr:hypothetical protein [Gammaproteobacteria bacterium]MCB1872452.1 hypothetical protein [Gammaproteobacteria bacterium]MCB1881672.1 hypothetical protein [Gammaproteobacteria bacterium]MCB1904945.1 hypothetical protein [Gammaproteobacteria bacterium]